MKSLILLCSLLGLPASAALAADSPWVGTWKLDEARSHLTGDTFTYSQGPGAMLHYSDGVNVSYDFGLDGKEYPAAFGRVTSWTVAGRTPGTPWSRRTARCSPRAAASCRPTA